MKRWIFAIVLSLAALRAEAMMVQSSATLDGGSPTTDYDEGRAIVRNSSTGDYYVAGTIEQSVGGTVNKEFYVARFNSSLVLQSSVTVHGSDPAQHDEAFGLDLDASGNVYVVGYVTNNDRDFFVAKFNSSLVLQSSVSFNGSASSSDDRGNAIVVSGSNLYVTGFWEETSGGQNLFLAKLNTSLVMQSSTSIQEAGDDSGNDLLVDGSNNIYVSGYISSTTTAGQDLFVVKFNSSLVIVTSGTANSGNDDRGNGIVADTSGGLYIAGALGNTLDKDIHLLKYNTSLVFQSSVTIVGSTGIDEARGIARDSTSGDLFISGYYYDSVANGSINLYAARFNSSLVLQSSASINGVGGNVTDEGYDVVLDASGNPIVAGFIGSGQTEIYVAKLVDDPFVPALSGSASGVSSITWSWVDLSTETGYRIAYGSDTLSFISGLLAADTTSFTETGLTTNTAYSRVLIAVGATNSSTSTAVTVYTGASVPSGLSVTDLNVSSFTANWSANGNHSTTTYRFEYWLPGGSTTTVDVPSLTSYTITSLGGGSTVFFQVSAFNDASVQSLPSTAFSTTTLPTQPVSAAITPGTAQTLNYFPAYGQVIVEVPASNFAQAVTLNIDAASLPLPTATAPGAQMRATGVAVTITPTPELASQSDVTITMPYREVDVAGFNENRLICARFPSGGSYWIPVIDSKPDPANNRVICKTKHFSTFQLMEVVPQNNFNAVKVYPNPFIPSMGHSLIKFANLPRESKITILTLMGERLAEISNIQTGLASWDGRNYSGKMVASGVYLVFINSPEGRQIFKLAVER